MRKARLVLALFVVVAVVAAAVRVGQDARRGGRGTAHGSSYRADEAGMLAARRVLEALDLPVESRRGPKLPDGRGHVLVRVEGGPQWRKIVPKEETAAAAELDAWVRRGNAVVLLGEQTPSGTAWGRIDGSGPPAWKPMLAQWESGQGPSDDAAETLDALFGADRAKVPEADLNARLTLADELASLEPPVVTGTWSVSDAGAARTLLSRGDDVVACERRHGDGAVVLVADPWIATNARLGNHPQNAAFLAALVEGVRHEGTVWFDDRAAGQAASRGVLSLFGEVGLAPALAAGLLLLLLVAWRAAPSDAPDRFVRPDVEYHPEQLALQRGELYADCVTVEEARRMVRDEVARRLGRGDATGCDRALALLAARDPGRAKRIRDALDALPAHPLVTPQRHPETWCGAVAGVLRALEEPRS